MALSEPHLMAAIFPGLRRGPSRALDPWVVALTALAVVAMACAPSSGNRPSDGVAGNGASARGPKVLTVALQRAPEDLHDDLGQRDPGVGGVGVLMALPNDTLVIGDEQGNWQPQLAAEQLSVERGTWRLNPDSTMDTVWKLRPGVKWQDGTPFTSADLVFSFGVYKDPEVPNGIGAPLGLMRSVEAPDPLTFVVHWSALYLDANRAPGLIPMPRHLLADVYATDKANFVASPRFTSEFVGLGPYRLVNWDPGSVVEFTRFDDYYQGRPPLDRVVARIIGDANALLANILAGAVDVILSEGVDLDAVLEVKQRWEGTGNQVLIRPASAGGGLRHLEIQFRPEFEQPKPGLPNLTVRQAMYQAINRQQLTEIITHGLGPVADSWVPPYHALRSQYEPITAAYAYDPAHAQQLLAQVGWIRGANGTLANSQSGDRFEITLYSSQGANVERAINVIGEDWKTVGAQVRLDVIPITLAGDREYRAKLPGAGFTGGVGYDAFSTDRLHSKFISAPANRWAASNRGGYANSRADATIDRIVVTLDTAQQVGLKKQLLQEHLADLATMPLYWDIRTVPVLKGVKGMEHGNWDLFHWDKE